MATPLEIKICGLTDAEDARLAFAAGADYLGFVLYAGSPRGISADAFRRLRDRLPAGARAVAGLVNAARPMAEALAREGGLHAVQLHGGEPAAEWAGFPLPVWRAVRLRAPADADPAAFGLDPDPAAWPAARYVLDAAVPGRYGGTGRTADWTRAGAAARHWPLMLAGGLTPANVAAAVRRARPLGVDVASGVESCPGRKDPVKLRAFLAAARAAERR